MVKVKKAVKINIIFLSLIIFILSRILFLSKHPLFFDSPEYLKLTGLANFREAINSAHYFLHPVYLLLGQWFHTILYEYLGNRYLSLLSFVIGLMGIITIASAFKERLNKDLAYCILFFALFPLSFLLDTNMLHETFTYGLLMMGIGLYVISTQKNKYVAIPSFLIISLSVINNLSSLLYLPLILTIFILLIKKGVVKTKASYSLLFLASSFLFGVFCYQLIIFFLNKYSLSGYNSFLVSGEFSQIMNLLSPIGLVRSVRNTIYLLTVYFHPLLLVVISFKTLKFLKNKNYPELFFLLVLFVTLLLFNSFWYGGLYGRVLYPISYIFAYLLGSFANDKIKKILLIIAFVTFFYNLSFYMQPPRYLMKSKTIEKYIDDSSTFILSDYERPQLTYPNFFYLTGDNEKEINKFIDTKLRMGSKVYITSEGLTFPTRSYDGQRIHLIAGKKEKSFVYLTLTYKYKLVEIESKKDFVLYEVTNNN